MPSPQMGAEMHPAQHECRCGQRRDLSACETQELPPIRCKTRILFGAASLLIYPHQALPIHQLLMLPQARPVPFEALAQCPPSVRVPVLYLERASPSRQLNSLQWDWPVPDWLPWRRLQRRSQRWQTRGLASQMLACGWILAPPATRQAVGGAAQPAARSAPSLQRPAAH